jgi:hypothetical protein
MVLQCWHWHSKSSLVDGPWNEWVMDCNNKWMVGAAKMKVEMRCKNAMLGWRLRLGHDSQCTIMTDTDTDWLMTMARRTTTQFGNELTHATQQWGILSMSNDSYSMLRQNYYCYKMRAKTERLVSLFPLCALQRTWSYEMWKGKGKHRNTKWVRKCITKYTNYIRLKVRSTEHRPPWRNVNKLG